MTHASGIFSIDLERVLVALQIDLLALRVDFMLAVLLVPFGHGRILVHVLDDFAPADARVIGAEADLALLRGIGNDAHLGAAEVVIKQVLEPHAGDEEEVPRVGLAPLDGVFIVAVR